MVEQTNKAIFDILGMGCTAVDDLLYVAAYPPADTKTQVLRRERQCGGLTATALVAAARLGARCAYAGILGTDEHSRFVIANFQKEGIDLTYLQCRPEARPIHSTIIVDEGQRSRNIFFNLAGSVGAPPDSPPAEVIQSCRVLLVDHYGIEGMTRAARLARAAGVAVVGDLERHDWPGFHNLLALVDHLILTWNFAAALTQEVEPAAAVRKLWQADRQAVVVTCGSDGCWYADAASWQTPCHLPAFAVPVVDTTGCGDVFHGAYAAALARGEDLQQRLVFAAAAAALKAKTSGAQAGIPTRKVVEAFLKEKGY